MLSYKPDKIKKNAWIVFGIISAIAIIIYVFVLFNIGIKYLNELLLALTLMADVLFLIRYLLYDYVYTINESGYFTVTRVYGKNNHLLADIRISRGDVILPYEKGADLSRYGSVMKKENFCSSAFPKSRYIYIFKSGDHKDAFILECGEDTAKKIALAIDYFGSRGTDGED